MPLAISTLCAPVLPAARSGDVTGGAGGETRAAISTWLEDATSAAAKRALSVRAGLRSLPARFAATRYRST